MRRRDQGSGATSDSGNSDEEHGRDKIRRRPTGRRQRRSRRPRQWCHGRCHDGGRDRCQAPNVKWRYGVPAGPAVRDPCERREEQAAGIHGQGDDFEEQSEWVHCLSARTRSRRATAARGRPRHRWRRAARPQARDRGSASPYSGGAPTLVEHAMTAAMKMAPIAITAAMVEPMFPAASASRMSRRPQNVGDGGTPLSSAQATRRGQRSPASSGRSRIGASVRCVIRMISAPVRAGDTGAPSTAATHSAISAMKTRP